MNFEHGRIGRTDDPLTRDPGRLNWNFGPDSASFLAAAIRDAIAAGSTAPLTRAEATAMLDDLQTFLRRTGRNPGAV